MIAPTRLHLLTLQWIRCRDAAPGTGTAKALHQVPLASQHLIDSTSERIRFFVNRMLCQNKKNVKTRNVC